MTERIKKLTALTLSGQMKPEAQKVSYDRTDLFLSEHRRNGKRIFEYVTAQKPLLTEYSKMTGLLVFDGSVNGDAMSCAGLSNVQALVREFYCKPIDNLSTFEWQHATADYQRVLTYGIRGLKAAIEESKVAHEKDCEALDFLFALDRCADAMILWAHKCADESEAFASTLTNEEAKQNLLTLAAALRRVPEHAPESFYEAVLSIYILFSYDPDSLGTLDRTLRPYYRKDLESGRLTRNEAKEYVQELFLMLQSRVSIKSDRFTRGGESHFAVGGYQEDGEDSFDDLSLLLIEAMCELPTYIPQISLRWTKKLPYEIFKKVMDMERHDPHKRLAFVNDEFKIRNSVQTYGFSYADACRYTTLGCNESAYPGGFVAGTTNTNAMHSVDSTFFCRTEDILRAESFEDFFKIYREELCADLDMMLKHSDDFNAVRARDSSYVSSLLFNACIEKAKSHSKGVFRLASSGFSLVGIPNVLDSLSVVKQFVYDEKRIDMQTLVSALRADWEGYEDLHTEIEKQGKFFGNDDDTSNAVAALYFDAIREHLKDKRNLFGYRCGIGNLQGYNPHHQIFGSKTHASPDGRKNGEMLKFGIGQSGGHDREGLTALLSSVAKCSHHRVMCGSSVTNLYLDGALIHNDENFEKTCRLLENYFHEGGTHFQLNYIDKSELIKAKESPDGYAHLRVRVSGFSDYFTNLHEAIQDDIIRRTTHDERG